MMNTLKTLLIFVCLFLIFPNLTSQSIIRQSINCFGTSSYMDGGVVSETVGQVYATKRFIGADLYLNPGFQQRMIAFIREGDMWEDLQIKLYPNPVSDELHLITSDVIEDARIEIIDIHGKVLLQSEQEISSDMIIQLGQFVEGLYHIRITDEKARKSYNSRIIIIK